MGDSFTQGNSDTKWKMKIFYDWDFELYLLSTSGRPALQVYIDILAVGKWVGEVVRDYGKKISNMKIWGIGVWTFSCNDTEYEDTWSREHVLQKLSIAQELLLIRWAPNPPCYCCWLASPPACPRLARSDHGLSETEKSHQGISLCFDPLSLLALAVNFHDYGTCWMPSIPTGWQ